MTNAVFFDVVSPLVRFEVFTTVIMKNAVFSMWRRVGLVRTDVSEESVAPSSGQKESATS
jgi:hypothetical protein